MWRRSGNPFRTFVHPPSEMMRIIERARTLSDLVVGERPPRAHLLREDAPRNRLRRVYAQGPSKASRIIQGAGSQVGAERGVVRRLEQFIGTAVDDSRSD
jgi:hypothetical protein